VTLPPLTGALSLCRPTCRRRRGVRSPGPRQRLVRTAGARRSTPGRGRGGDSSAAARPMPATSRSVSTQAAPTSSIWRSADGSTSAKGRSTSATATRWPTRSGTTTSSASSTATRF